MKTPRFIAAVSLAFVVLTHSASTAPSDLDLTFGGTGKVTTLGGRGKSMVQDSDGKIIVVGDDGFATFIGRRYNSDGSLDISFADSLLPSRGEVGVGNSVAVQSDGKIVIVGYMFDDYGYPTFMTARHNRDGSLDTTFGGTGIVTTDIRAGAYDEAECVVVQSDGKIIAAGWVNNLFGFDFAMVRYNSNGSLDTNFGNSGIVRTDFGSRDMGRSMALQAGGNIVIVGSSGGIGNEDFAIVRYNPDGSPDSSFGSGGKVMTPISGGEDIATSVALQADGKIVVAGHAGSGISADFAVVRYAANGALDQTFNSTGKVTTPVGGNKDLGNCVAIQSGGIIVVSGVTYNGSNDDSAVVRYLSDGRLDTSFGGNGKVVTAFGTGDDGGVSVGVQSNGRIIVAGYARISQADHFTVVRYEGDPDTDSDGIPDRYETGTGIYVSPTDTGTSPINPDSDEDGLTDGQEVNTYHTNPNKKDTDGDGWDDAYEIANGFDPNSTASTPDTLSSILPAVEYRFHVALGISYRIESSTDLATWMTIETPIMGTGGVITRLYSIEGQPKQFFRSRRN